MVDLTGRRSARVSAPFSNADHPTTQRLNDPMADVLMSALYYRDLKALDEFAQVVELERVIWGPGYDEVVPVPILAVTVLRGGILIGAFVDDASTGSASRMVGFVYSLPGIKHGRPMQ